MPAPKKTDLELLQDSQAESKTLQSEIATLTSDKLALQQLVDEAQSSITALGTEKAALTQQVTDATAAKVKVETEFRQLRERDARNGGTLPAKDATAGDFTSKTDDAAIWDTYLAAGPAEKSRMRATQGEALQKAATAFDKRQAA